MQRWVLKFEHYNITAFTSQKPRQKIIVCFVDEAITLNPSTNVIYQTRLRSSLNFFTISMLVLNVQNVRPNSNGRVRTTTSRCLPELVEILFQTTYIQKNDPN